LEADLSLLVVDAQSPSQLLAGADRNRALLHDQLGRTGFGSDQAGDVVDCGQVGITRRQRRRVDADEDHIAVTHGLAGIGGEGQTAGRQSAPDHLLQIRFKKRHLSFLEAIDFGFVYVGADNIVADFSQTGAGHQADIPTTYECDSHGSGALLLYSVKGASVHRFKVPHYRQAHCIARLQRVV
jgi:hypothetical protein